MSLTPDLQIAIHLTLPARNGNIHLHIIIFPRSSAPSFFLSPLASPASFCSYKKRGTKKLSDKLPFSQQVSGEEGIQ